MRAEPRGKCHVCGAGGRELYTGLKDKLFDAPGAWRMVRCADRRCGLMWLDPMPNTEDLGSAYSHYYTHTDNDNFPPEWPGKQAYKAFLQRRFAYPYGVDSRLQYWRARMLPHRIEELAFRVMYLKRHVGGRLLEIGCGGGAMLELMANLGWSAEGVDFDQKAVAVARSRGLEVRLGSVEQQGYADNYFDAVTTSHLIEHVPDPRALLLEIKRILKPGGKLVVVTPNGRSSGHALFRRRWRGLEPPRHLHIFNRDALRALTKECGLDVDQLRTTIRAADTIVNFSLELGRRDAIGIGLTPVNPRPHLARFLQLTEWVYSLVNRDAGEELLLIAIKPALFSA